MKMRMPSVLLNIDEKNRYYIFIGALAVVLVADYVVLMKPQMTALMKLAPEIKILSQDIQKAEGEIQKKNFYKEEVRRLEDKIRGHSLQVKPKDDVPLLLERLSQLAGQNAVELDQIMPFSQDQEVILQDNKRTYYVLPILVEARSGYHGLGRFLDHLEKDNISVDVASFTITATSDARYHQVTLNLEATVFEDE